jgi:hypothetical protein
MGVEKIRGRHASLSQPSVTHLSLEFNAVASWRQAGATRPCGSCAAVGGCAVGAAEIQGGRDSGVGDWVNCGDVADKFGRRS